MKTLEPVLKEHAFLKKLRPEYLKILVGCAANVHFAAGKYIFHEGEAAGKFFLIREGKIAIEIHAPGGDPIIIQTIGPGDVLGWSWLIPPYRWSFDARAVESTRAIALDGRCLRGKFDKNHSLGYELLRRFSQVIVKRLEATRLQLLDLYGFRPRR
jgi:CRP-like cAMP-binding protein